MTTMKTATTISLALLFLAAVASAPAQTNRVAGNRRNSTPPARDPHTPGFVAATELPDGTVPSPEADGNFIIGPTHPFAPEMSVNTNVPQGTILISR